MTGNENHVDKCLPGGGGGVGSLGGGSGDGVSLNLNSFKRYFACLKKAKHRNYVHCRWRGCIMYQRIKVLTYFWRRLRCGLVDLGRLTMEGTTSNDDIVVTGKSVNILKAAVLSVA